MKRYPEVCHPERSAALELRLIGVDDPGQIALTRHEVERI